MFILRRFGVRRSGVRYEMRLTRQKKIKKKYTDLRVYIIDFSARLNAFSTRTWAANRGGGVDTTANRSVYNIVFFFSRILTNSSVHEVWSRTRS